MHHEELSESLDGVERPDQAMERRQGIREVLAAVQALPERQRDALLLRELEGRSYDEIAVELRVTGGAVRQLLNRARTTLRAGASAVTPVGLLARLPFPGPDEPVSSRVAEMLSGAGAGAVAAKLCATALVTGAVVGGVASVPHKDGSGRLEAPAGTEDAVARTVDDSPGDSHPGNSGTRAHAVGDEKLDGGGDERGDARRREGHSGPGGGDDRRPEPRRGDGEDHSGRGGPGPGDDSDLSSPGGGEEESHSGPGGGGEGSTLEESHSGSGESGSSESGSGESGSGESGSGSGESGSGESGSGETQTDGGDAVIPDEPPVEPPE